MVIAVSAARAQPPEQGRAPARDRAVSEKAALLAEILGTAGATIDQAELAGMAKGAKPEVLTLEQAYTLAMIRARTPAASRTSGEMNDLSAKSLEERAHRAEAGDFERFRKEFVSGTFRDPTRRFFAVLKHRADLDSARDQLALAENMRRLFEKVFRSEVSGVSQLQVELIEQSVLVSGQSRAIDMISYRSATDELKVALGLPAATPLVVDERILRPFATAFAAIDGWQRNPNRRLEDLSGLHDRLPRLEEAKISGRTLTEVVQGSLAEAQFLASCVDTARSNRAVLKDDHNGADDRYSVELRIRRMVRHLIMTHTNYEIARKRLELAVREVDQRIEQMVAPPLESKLGLSQRSNAAFQTPGVMQAQTQLCHSRAEFVSLWLQFKEQSLAVYRELGYLPYENWDAFYRSFVPVAGRASQSTSRVEREGEPPRG
jgi:hypothetical protein